MRVLGNRLRQREGHKTRDAKAAMSQWWKSMSRLMLMLWALGSGTVDAAPWPTPTGDGKESGGRIDSKLYCIFLVIGSMVHSTTLYATHRLQGFEHPFTESK